MGRATAAGPKIYNVTLDSEGDAIVSATVWARIQEALALIPGAPQMFLYMNEVQEPPTQVIGGSPERDRRVFLQTDALREIAPTGGPPPWQTRFTPHTRAGS